jgi:hypothetical protein
MSREPLAQRVAGYLIRRACRRLPDDTREERYREWTSELPAILHDPGVRFAPRRSARTLFYAADTLRSTRSLRRAAGSPRRHSYRGPVTPGVLLTWPALIRRAGAGVGIYLGVVALTIALITLFHPDNVWPLTLMLVAGAGFVTFCLISLARADEVRYLPKWGWALFCIFSIPFGGIMYLTIGRVRRPHRAPPRPAGQPTEKGDVDDAVPRPGLRAHWSSLPAARPVPPTGR